jgi:hypothetical protein
MDNETSENKSESNFGRNTAPNVIVSASSGVSVVLPLWITPMATVVY